MRLGKKNLVAMLVLAAFVAPMLVSCGSPTEGAKDVLPGMTPEKQAKKNKKEGG